MTYPQGLPSSSQPSDIHDATWGVLSAVYGGAVHPSAEGHAAMADGFASGAFGAFQLSAAVPEVTARSRAARPLTFKGDLFNARACRPSLQQPAA